MAISETSSATQSPLSSFKLEGATPSAREQRVRALIRLYSTIVLRQLRRHGVPPGCVDDAAQRVFWVASRKLERLEVSGECAFLLGTAARVASDVRRVEARRARREVALEDDAESHVRLDEMLELKRMRSLLDAVLSGMPRELSEVLVLSEAEGLTAPEISQRCGIPVGTVASRLNRARRLMKRRTRQLSFPLRHTLLSVG